MIEELEQQIIELGTELSEQYSYIAELEEEIFELYSQQMETQIAYGEEVKSRDNKITDLEYELFLEKTRDSNHKFYWFIANKIPFIADVSYLNNENTLFGFKDVPVYSTIEKYDLRFITNCSLDDLIEQF